MLYNVEKREKRWQWIVDKRRFAEYNKKVMKAYEYVEQFKAKYCDVDFKDQLKASGYLAVFEEVACASANELGFGEAYLKPRNFGFIVSAVRVRIENPIALGEKYSVSSWPLKPSYASFLRQYRLQDEHGAVRAVASARWCLIDFTSGRLLTEKSLPEQDYSSYSTAVALEVPTWKLQKFAREDGELRFQMTVANSEYDHYMHVNNTRYIDYALNCFSVEELSKKRLREFALSYLRQCHESDVLSFYRKEVEKDKFIVQGYGTDGELSIVAELCFQA